MRTKRTNRSYLKDNIRNTHFAKFRRQSITGSDRYSKYIKSKFGLSNIREKVRQEVKKEEEKAKTKLTIKYNNGLPNHRTINTNSKISLGNFGFKPNSNCEGSKYLTQASMLSSPVKNKNSPQMLQNSNHIFSTGSLLLSQDSVISHNEDLKFEDQEQTVTSETTKKKQVKPPTHILKKLEIKQKIKNLQHSLESDTVGGTYNQDLKSNGVVRNFLDPKFSVLSDSSDKMEIRLLSQKNSLKSLDVSNLKSIHKLKKLKVTKFEICQSGGVRNCLCLL
ncbi:unnamed protein product [Moneuplotes crassus]|uniref:Uncharacterized protein n=1 Tax=Euplotes crassus TaxID=5936 RepID=A0AAD1UDL4_EUPCR|nr:unnamed protein product [Moneuplotes crassus]